MWRCGEFTFDTSKPLVMAILNMTPDSFSDGGVHYQPGEEIDRGMEQTACVYARALIKAGATIIDVGGESTRPGSQKVSIAEELKRVLPVVKTLASEGIPVSIDTRHAEVAAQCVESGAAIINDVTGFTQTAMREVATSSQAGCIIMHMHGEPGTMQDNPCYNDAVEEVEAFLLAQAHLLEHEGVASDRIAIDPGPGFGKTFDHNKALLLATHRLASHGYPLVAAWSRKRFIGELTGVVEPHKRLAGSLAIALYAASQGAHIFRVHDVAETAEALLAFNQLHQQL